MAFPIVNKLVKNSFNQDLNIPIVKLEAPIIKAIGDIK